MSKEGEFKTAQFEAGYRKALEDVFDELTEMHKTPGLNRKEIDRIWEFVKRLSDRTREAR